MHPRAYASEAFLQPRAEMHRSGDCCWADAERCYAGLASRSTVFDLPPHLIVIRFKQRTELSDPERWTAHHVHIGGPFLEARRGTGVSQGFVDEGFQGVKGSSVEFGTPEADFAEVDFGSGFGWEHERFAAQGGRVED